MSYLISKTCEVSTFFNHEVQNIMALFLTKPELYNEYAIHKNRQDYFFHSFRKFAANYYNFSGDESVYFASTRKEYAGETNVRVGRERTTGASARNIKDRYRKIEQDRVNRIDLFAKRYGISFAAGKDPRLFVGVTEIWNKLDKALEIVAASEWSDAKEKTYSDASFETPIPEKVKKILIPLSIRNKVMQKMRNRIITGTISHDIQIDEETVSENKHENAIKTGIVVVVPDDIHEDW